ncbi:hypothetical protein MMMDOFMJ_1212 [Methylobacterium gnaphalii]|nr:hypothetical protein MMMDOFMJ_1212 [Methylobacterium gnaphalii]
MQGCERMMRRRHGQAAGMLVAGQRVVAGLPARRVVLGADDSGRVRERGERLQRGEESLQEQRVERGHGNDRAAWSRSVRWPAHGSTKPHRETPSMRKMRRTVSGANPLPGRYSAAAALFFLAAGLAAALGSGLAAGLSGFAAALAAGFAAALAGAFFSLASAAV